MTLLFYLVLNQAEFTVTLARSILYRVCYKGCMAICGIVCTVRVGLCLYICDRNTRKAADVDISALETKNLYQ